MGATPQMIDVSTGVNIDELLADADESPVLLSKNGAVYQLTREDKANDIWYGYDPERVRQALDEVAESGGILDGIDIDKWIADIYEAREQGSRHNFRR